MTLTLHDLKNIDQHWAVQAIPSEIQDRVFEAADERLIRAALDQVLHNTYLSEVTDKEIENVATAYEMAAIEGLSAVLRSSTGEENVKLKNQAQAGAYRAFGLYRVLPIPTDTDYRIFNVLHLAGLAYCGERWTDLKRWFSDFPKAIAIPPVDDVQWDKRLLYRLFDCWIRLLRKSDWDDLGKVSEIVLGLRNDQSRFESLLVEEQSGAAGKATALQLIALYHFAKATERLAVYMLQGEPAAIDSELDQHFEAAVKAAKSSRDVQLEMVLNWLHLASRKMAEGSLWWVAHTVNSRVKKFVNHVTKHRGMFELFPPQRAALQEQGLLDQASRAVVVDLPTSSGKTQLSQFRMLQALNQFDQDNGWVAYVAPTRALVSQITRRLRSDFEPLNIHVEQLSGAIEVDAFEETLLRERQAFQVLVATPEKLQLVMRNKKIARPLALVVMDEAHNIEDKERGLRIELLLATIKQESPSANFLLMMPFVPNTEDLAQWLAADRGRTISLGTTAWQPNERLVGMFNVTPFDSDRGERQGDWHLNFETLTTTQRTIHLHGIHEINGVRPLKKLNYSKVQGSLSAQAVAMAKSFSDRGTSIAIAQTIPDVWSIARKVAAELPAFEQVPSEVALVQRFLATEVSEKFELINMLSKGVVVHHAGLPAEVLALIEWLTEAGHIRVMCATTTIAQGLNFPVSSVFLATTKYPYGIQMSHRAFWNLAGRTGRIGQNSVGVVGIAAGKDQKAVRDYVNEAIEELISRMESLLDELYKAGELNNLSTLIKEDQWVDFRSYIAHLWNEKRNLDIVIGEAEQTLRNTLGFSALRAKSDDSSFQKAEALLKATRSYVKVLAEYPENATLADATGFSPEGVRSALLGMGQLENNLSIESWEPSSLFGDSNSKTLPDLMGIMMKIPQLKSSLEELTKDGVGYRKLADITQAWVSGKSLADIADSFFDSGDFTTRISKACKAVYRDLANNAAWGLSALSKMPTSGLNFEEMSDEEKRSLNNLPAMIYHGVKTEEAVLMRMSSVPRSIAEATGAEFKRVHSDNFTPATANEYLKSLQASDWERMKPQSATMSGGDYQTVWKKLSGLDD